MRTKSIVIATMAAFSLFAGMAAFTLKGSAAENNEKEVERYRQMLDDPFANPGFLNVERGEQLWHLKRGTKNVSLESCDLGEGPGILKGAYAHLPRYFADAGKVMDLEQRLLWCMDKVQGLDIKPIMAKAFAKPGQTSDMEDLVAFIANKSNGVKISLPLSNPKEKEAYAIGEALFFRRSSLMDFSCATCHGQEGKRIRLQNLPDLATPNPTAIATMVSHPAYRASESELRTMQNRLDGCYKQMRLPAPNYASDANTDLILYMTKQAEGGAIHTPGMKR